MDMLNPLNFFKDIISYLRVMDRNWFSQFFIKFIITDPDRDCK